MKTLHFLVEWQKDKKRTWSGTCWGLYKALQKHFIVKDIDIHESLLNKIIRKIFRIDTNLGLLNIKRNRNRVLTQLSSTQQNYVFQFAEFIQDNLNTDSYIYIDVDVNYVKHLFEHEPKIFMLSNFANSKITSINARNESQVSYFTNCKGIFTMGNWLRNSIIERLNISPDLIHHVGGGINLDTTKIKDSRKGHNKILFIGRDFERKGGFLVLEAFILLKHQNHRNKNIELHIAGPSKCPFNDIISGVFYYGDAPHSKIEELMNTCDIFCMPSYFEAYGLVFIEALAFGLPCIGRNAYEMPFFIENEVTGLLIDNDKPEELANKMELLLNDPSYTQRVKARRDWYITNYSWDTVANRIANIIQTNAVKPALESNLI